MTEDVRFPEVAKQPPPPLDAAIEVEEKQTAAASETADLQALAAAASEAQHWNVAPPRPLGIREFRARRERAARSIRTARLRIDKLAAKARRLPAEARLIAESASTLWSASHEAGDALKTNAISKLVWVRAKEEAVPRAYALARGFLECKQFQFEEGDLLAYLAAAQEHEPLNMNELWALKPMLQAVLLEEIGRAADCFLKDCGRTAKGLSLRTESSSAGLALLIRALDAVEHTRWGLIFQKASKAEGILRQDPAGIYPRMDPDSRGLYQKTVSDLAAHSRASETEIAALTVSFARRARPEPGEDGRIFARKKHSGYYLLDDGRRRLESRIHYRPPFHEQVERFVLAWPELFYIVGIELLTAAIIVFFLSGLHRATPPLAAILLLLLPATESAVRIMNQLTSFLIHPRALPKLDFSHGIPPDCATLVVIPTLLISAQQVRETAAELEVRYLANADPNLYFALLTDSPDSSRRFDEHDQLVELCARLIDELNQKYERLRQGSFFLFHRHRVYNPIENAWMGWERKRGKLLDLNRLLRNGSDSFPVKCGDLSVLSKIQYVITLDSDTSLPRGSAERLVGAIVHPLNRAVVNPKTNTVVKGYGILQPRVGVSVQSAAQSRLASLLSGQSGFDIYTRAVSDVYQDLFAEGSFTGKGIYEVDVYQQVLGQRFPPNALLSHDLIEGSYARAGLLSDVEVIDDYPSHFSAYSRRKHRWIRGDWQILRWLWTHVPDFAGKQAPNPITFISRWKIIDNLRRSLLEAATLVLLLGGWFFLPGGALYWTVATLVLLLMPSYLQLFVSIVLAAGAENRRGYLADAARNFVAEQVNVLLTLMFLFHQALVTLDAIIRTLVRLMLTHRKLLEWETAAQAELRSRKRTPVEICLDLSLWLSVGIGVALAFLRPAALPVALPFLVVWACSKPISRWVDALPSSERKRLSAADEALLRESALRAWRYFREWSHAGTNWLIPDHVQESPQLVANVISPTNLGFLLNARLAALDLGYLTLEEFARDTEQTLLTALRMPRFNGHFFNWVRTDNLEPLNPLFVSTVDSANLAACLWTVKQGCLEIVSQPLWSPALWQGLRDEWRVLRSLARKSSNSTAWALRGIQRHFDGARKSAPEWIAALPDIARKTDELKISPRDGRAGERKEELHWWLAEFSARVAALRQMAACLTPWLLPEYSALFQQEAVNPGLDVARLSLASLPAALPRLASNLQVAVNNPALRQEARAQAHRLLELIEPSASAAKTLADTLRRIAGLCDTAVMDMDFEFLQDPASELLSVGYHVKEKKLEGACYGLLASEARTASLIAIAKGDVRQEHWFRLGRAHTIYKGQRVLLSWSGTMFEYLMAAVWMKCYPDTVLGQSQYAAVNVQQSFARARRRPWGVSEAAWSKKDDEGRYQYRAFGIPRLGLSPDVLADVVAPYATFLALETHPGAAIRNLQRMKGMGWSGAYGFYESADYQRVRQDRRGKYELVRSWMAHHQGMTLLSVCNFLSDSSIQRRFAAEPRIRATDLILHERLPASVPVVPPEAAPRVLAASA
ncbi:MAG: glucoamylase family protein [Terriglobia bacterium]